MAQRVRADVLKRVVVEILESFSVPLTHAEMAANALVEADLLGLETHGVAHLLSHPSYVPGLESGLVSPRPEVRVTETAPSLLKVDGGKGMGLVAMTTALEAVSARSGRVGIAIAWIENSYHAGALAYFTRCGALQGMLTIACTNTRPSVAPTYARKAALGTNPISIAVPYQGDRVLLLDMATSAVAAGKVEQSRREGNSVPFGWMIDNQGRDSTNPGDYFDGGALLPLGSTPELSSYKGYGLGVMVDVMTGLLSGMGHSLILPTHGHSHMIACIDIARIRTLDEFQSAVSDMVDDLHALPNVADHEVLVPGEREWRTYEERTARGIPVSDKILEQLRQFVIQRGITTSFSW